ncbi:U-box domain-containing protein 27-like [Dorcoceras hygrometricum]|uniref:U-box domain-containing protein n=1 Tax=Dorcoceras hygrometricum TaxID=472368 RepID=A0A2Z7DB56_9LAMI|nr:U-box domain-containing protein 27-like [Dorcoceras hygrometricum]
MVNDDLHITVPTYFRCPISLEVMKSPVSLCTGVTYDRRSIQRWLDAGNNTCPATMQQLPTKDLVPNHTLHRLIKLWSESVPTRPENPPPSPQSLSRDRAEQIILQLEIDLKMIHNTPFPRFSTLSHNLSTLISFVNEGCDNRKVVMEAGGRIFPLLVSLVGKKQSLNDLCLLEKIILLCNVTLKNLGKIDSDGSDNAKFPAIEMGKYDYKTIIMTCLKQGRLELRIAVVEFLELMATHLGSQMQQSSLIPQDDEMYFELLRLIVDSNWNTNALEASLNILSRFVVYKKNISNMVRAGLVKALTKALSEPELSPPLTEKVLKLLEIASSCREGRNEICGNELCVQAILKKVLKVSNTATELAVTLLWSLCCFSGDKRVAVVVAESSGVAKILLLLQSNCSPNIRRMCGDLLKMFRCNSKGSCLSCYDTKTSHIMPF